MKSYRPERVANVVRQVVSEAIAHRLSDPRIDPLASVTRVEVSGDLEYAKVYVSVLGEAVAGRRTMQGLKSATGHVQRLVAQELHIRQCPHLTFHLDESLKKAAQTMQLIRETMAEYEARDQGVVDQPVDTAPEQQGEGA